MGKQSQKIRSITVIGLGLIGGSIAKAAARAGIEVCAVDTCAPSLDRALKDGVIKQGYAGLCKEALRGELAVICTPPETVLFIAGQVNRLTPYMLMTDTGSVKLEVTEQAKRAGYRFIGGHPMAGTEKRGYAASAAHMFENAYYILTPSADAKPNDIKLLEGFVRSIGAKPCVMDSRQHDEAVAAVSHLPHIISAALINTVCARDDEGVLASIAAGGLRDITRISSSEPSLWAEICAMNKDALYEAIADYRRVLDWAQQACQSGDLQALEAYFTAAKTYRDALPKRAAAVENGPELTIDAQDKPGEIGRIATLLGTAGINIKSIYLSGTRERGEGVLVIGLLSGEDAQAAAEVLGAAGYGVR